MKGLFIYYTEIINSEISGIDQKVLWQLEEFNKAPLTCELVVFNDQNKSLSQKVISRLPFTKVKPTWKYMSEFNDIDFLYFRRPSVISKNMINILMEIKKNNPTIKIILEIPTYPYDGEFKTQIINYPYYWKDVYYRKKLRNVVDRIAVQNNIDEIFGIPTLNFTNGIKIQDVSVRKVINKDNDDIEICAVASMEPWQGYERVIESLYKFYRNGNTRNIIIHFVGDGNQLKFYKELTDKYQLSDHIFFYGFQKGNELKDIYNKSDIALDAFGRYKTNNPISTSLKSREYLAKGLPIVSGSSSDLFYGTEEYYLEFPNSSSTFDFNEIISFYDSIYGGKSKQQIANKIRNHAYEICDISNTMNEITDFIKK